MSIKNQQELVSLEILTFSEDVSNFNEEQLKEKYNSYKESFTLVNDLSQPYVIRTVVGDYKDIRSYEPDMIPESDRYEITESIQDVLKNKDVPVYKSDFNQAGIENTAIIKEQMLNNAIKTEMFNGLKAMKDGKINPEMIKAPKELSDKVGIEIAPIKNK